MRENEVSKLALTVVYFLALFVFVQPMVYAPGAPPGSTMIPMVLPDGRLVYV
jgi:hypothetical protein